MCVLTCKDTFDEPVVCDTSHFAKRNPQEGMSLTHDEREASCGNYRRTPDRQRMRNTNRGFSMIPQNLTILKC